MGQLAARVTSKVIAYLPAGAHEVYGVATQEIGTKTVADGRALADVPIDNEPDEDLVVIGNRKMIVLRFAQGAWLGA